MPLYVALLLLPQFAPCVALLFVEAASKRSGSSLAGASSVSDFLRQAQTSN